MVRTIVAVVAIMLLSTGTNISRSSGEARADPVARPRLDIRKQVDRAEYVVLATVVRKEHLGTVDPTSPMGKCGVRYEIRIDEQFKGKLQPSVGFVTYQILIPEREIRTGERALMLLSNLSSSAKQTDAESVYSAITSCGKVAPSIYLSQSGENFFPVATDISAGHTWMYYTTTTMPNGFGTVQKDLCVPPKKTCAVASFQRVLWPEFRRALISYLSVSRGNDSG